MLTPTKKIVPFRPRRFPPRELDRTAFSANLLKANRALNNYAKILATGSFPSSIFSLLITLESIASLHSQHIKTSLKEVLQANAKLRKLKPITNYSQALQWSCKKIQSTPINEALIFALHKKIKQGTSLNKEIGSYRKRQNWIGPSKCNIEQAYFYPPAPRHVNFLMRELQRYCRTKSKEPLLQLAIAFAQLLIIHPFMDGNGRIARMLIPLFLYRKKCIPLPLFFMSSYFKRYRLRYVQTLYLTTEESRWEPWISFFLKGVTREATKTSRRLKKISYLYQTMKQSGINPEVLDFLFQQPVFSLSAFKKSKKSNALLTQLIKTKWIQKDKKGLFVFIPLIKLLKSV